MRKERKIVFGVKDTIVVSEITIMTAEN